MRPVRTRAGLSIRAGSAVGRFTAVRMARGAEVRRTSTVSSLSTRQLNVTTDNHSAAGPYGYRPCCVRSEVPNGRKGTVMRRFWVGLGWLVASYLLTILIINIMTS
jgi:hypothetical protein